MLRPLVLSLILHLAVLAALGWTTGNGDASHVEASLDFEVLPAVGHAPVPRTGARAKAKVPVADETAPPSGDAAPVAEGAPSAESSAAKSGYVSGLRAAIEAEKRYPRVAIARREEGTVEVAFTLKKDGLISDIHIARSSPYPTLDREAVDTLARLGKFKPVPDEITSGDWKVVVPLEFKLEE